MTSIKSISKKIGFSAFIETSRYFTVNNSVIRVSDHLPKTYNIEMHNENVENMLLILVGSFNESEVEKYIEMLEKNTSILFDYYIIEDENDELAIDIIKHKISKL